MCGAASSCGAQNVRVKTSLVPWMRICPVRMHDYMVKHF